MDCVTEFPTETSRLLHEQEQERSRPVTDSAHAPGLLTNPRVQSCKEISPVAVLPIALLAALALATTSATEIFAYADLLCKNPTHCHDDEKTNYARAVAMAVIIANVCALLALGPLAEICSKNHKICLTLWLVCRSMNVATLAFGVYMRSIGIALFSRLFEGFASDNLLHFSLNTIYVQMPDKEQISRYIGSSLALYMVGISISPAVASLLLDFTASFAMALSIFAIALIYLLGVPTKQSAYTLRAAKIADTLDGRGKSALYQLCKSSQSESFIRFLSPLQPFYMKPIALAPGISLLLYNIVQSYVFPAIMVHTSLEFGFSSRENGYLLTIAHTVSSIYLFTSLLAIPSLLRLVPLLNLEWTAPFALRTGMTNAALAILSILVETTSLVLLAFATEAWQTYPIIAMCAVGFATPSFIKSYFVTLFPRSAAPQAIAALTMMETLGSLLAPVVLGGLQTARPGSDVFFAAAVIAMASALLFGTGFFLERITRSHASNDDVHIAE